MPPLPCLACPLPPRGTFLTFLRHFTCIIVFITLSAKEWVNVEGGGPSLLYCSLLPLTMQTKSDLSLHWMATKTEDNRHLIKELLAPSVSFRCNSAHCFGELFKKSELAFVDIIASHQWSHLKTVYLKDKFVCWTNYLTNLDQTLNIKTNQMDKKQTRFQICCWLVDHYPVITNI